MPEERSRLLRGQIFDSSTHRDPVLSALPNFFSISSLRRILGLPFALFLSNGAHFVVFLAHPWLFFPAMCPAHLSLASTAFLITSFAFFLALRSSFLILSLIVAPSAARGGARNFPTGG